MSSRCGVNRYVTPLFNIIRVCPPQTRWFGYHIPSTCFFSQVPQHLLHILLRVGHNPEIVGPHGSACLMCLFFLRNAREYPFFSLHLGQGAGWPSSFHNKRTSTLPWRKHGLETKVLATHSNMFSQNCRDQPSVCVVFCMIFATCLGLASSKAVFISMLDKHGGAHYTAMPQHGNSVHLQVPLLSQQNCCHYCQTNVGNLFHSTHPHAIFHFSNSLSRSTRRIMHDACDCKTLVCTRSPCFLIPFVGSASVIRTKTNFI